MNFEDFWKNEIGPSHFAGLPAPKDLARAAWNRAMQAEREECAKTCEALWQEEATAAANGTQEPKYHDAIECGYAIRERSNVKSEGG